MKRWIYLSLSWEIGIRSHYFMNCLKNNGWWNSVYSRDENKVYLARFSEGTAMPSFPFSFSLFFLPLPREKQFDKFWRKIFRQSNMCFLFFLLEMILSHKRYEYSVSDIFIKEIQTLIDILRNRDKKIQVLMQIMEERFEKVWKLPWDLVKIIHSFTWNRDDFRDISSNVCLLSWLSLSISISVLQKCRVWTKRSWKKGRKSNW